MSLNFINNRNKEKKINKMNHSLEDCFIYICLQISGGSFIAYKPMNGFKKQKMIIEKIHRTKKLYYFKLIKLASYNFKFLNLLSQRTKISSLN